MLSSRSRGLAAAFAAVLALSSSAFASPRLGMTDGVQTKALPSAGQLSVKKSQKRLDSFMRAYTGGYKRGPGWSQAHVKRMARKARNVSRNKRAHRGK